RGAATSGPPDNRSRAKRVGALGDFASPGAARADPLVGPAAVSGGPPMRWVAPLPVAAPSIDGALSRSFTDSPTGSGIAVATGSVAEWPSRRGTPPAAARISPTAIQTRTNGESPPPSTAPDAAGVDACAPTARLGDSCLFLSFTRVSFIRA